MVLLWHSKHWFNRSGPSQFACPLHWHWILQFAPTYPKSHLQMSGLTQEPLTQPCVQTGTQVPAASLWPCPQTHLYSEYRSSQCSESGSHLWCPFSHSFSGGHLTKFHVIVSLRFNSTLNTSLYKALQLGCCGPSSGPMSEPSVQIPLPFSSSREHQPQCAWCKHSSHWVKLEHGDGHCSISSGLMTRPHTPPAQYNDW